MKRRFNIFLFLISGMLFFVSAGVISAEQQSVLRTEQLLEIQVALSKAETELGKLQESASNTTEQQNPDLFVALRKQRESVANLQLALEKTVTGGLSMQSFDTPEQEFDWRQELTDIVKPALESLKQLTSKPRQTTELTNAITRIEEQQQVLAKGLTDIYHARESSEDVALTASLERIQQEWQELMAEMVREKAIIGTQLEALQDNDGDRWLSFSRSMEGFFAGRALTLLLAIVFALGVWLLFRILNRRLWRHHASRRGSPLYRFFMYSFHAFSTIFIVLAVFVVFYLRDDVLLLGLGLLVLIAGLLSLQQALPRFLREVNLLLNLGSAREGERVMYNGVPYRVQSLNVFSTLSNPELRGTQRLPLEQLAALLSRPALDDESWFPSSPGDVLLMPDDKLVTVEQQSVEQVVLKTLGGALVHYQAADFFGLNLTNLTRSGSFVVSTVFGLDYQYQENILDDYPALIREEVPKALQAAGIDEALYSGVNVEFKTANASSLDLMIWATFDSQLAISLYKLERILQQACLRVCNKHKLTIPFPQLAIHVESNGQ